jgi:hypothetical protein
MSLANPLLRPCNRHISMWISSPKPCPIPPAANPKFQLLHQSRPNLHALVDNASALRGLRQQISHPMFNRKLNPKLNLLLNPTSNPMFNLHRRLRPPVHRRVAPAAVVAVVDEAAVAANKPSRKPSLPPQ